MVASPSPNTNRSTTVNLNDRVPHCDFHAFARFVAGRRPCYKRIKSIGRRMESAVQKQDRTTDCLLAWPALRDDQIGMVQSMPINGKRRQKNDSKFAKYFRKFEPDFYAFKSVNLEQLLRDGRDRTGPGRQCGTEPDQAADGTKKSRLMCTPRSLTRSRNCVR